MNYNVIVLFILLLPFRISAATAPTTDKAKEARITMSFDQDWRFLKADAAGAEKPEFNDASWRKLDVPHDWSIEGPFDQNNPTGSGGGYLPAGIGWYRKTFSLPTGYASYLASIEFDGIMANSDVWINGFHLGKRPYGYVSFSYDLTGHLNFGKGKTNVIAVRADNSNQPASRWYTGAGIYRHVRFVATQPVHLKQWGVFVTTPEIAPAKALVRIKTTLTNQSKTQQNITLQTTVMGMDGETVQSTQTTQPVHAGKSIEILQNIAIPNPKLWNIDQPYLYHAVSKIVTANSTIDSVVTPFGIREAKFEAATGFWLNGKNLKLKGVCLHQDGGPVGAAVPLRVWERRLELLKQIGVNAIRTAHNPVAPEFLDACDRLGFLVMDETFDTWTAQKKPAIFGYHLFFKDWWKNDTRDIVMRDRNHPSIIIYSVGNEIHDNLNSPGGFNTYTNLRDLIHDLDSTRPVTTALFRPNTSQVYNNGFAELMDVVGQNYRENELIAAHQAKPERKVIGTENGHTRAAWLELRDNPFMAGQFLWTGIDYIGETNWPNVVRGAGLIDRNGTFKPRAYERQSWWSDKPMVRIARSLDNSEMLESDGSDGTKGISRLTCDWTPRNVNDYNTANIQVFSNCKEIELFLNGKSLGTQTSPADDSPCKWSFPFERGTLKAIAKNNGQVVATDELRTASQPTKIILTADKANIANTWDDVSYITATVADSLGTCTPAANHLIKFKITGPGFIAAVDNGNLANTEPFQATEHLAYQGSCIAIVKASASAGKITITASADGLETGSISLDAVAP